MSLKLTQLIGFNVAEIRPAEQEFSSPGSHSFTVPQHTSLFVECYGAGGPGTNFNEAEGSHGTASTWDSGGSFPMTANGGSRGFNADSGGAGGTATGGTSNIQGDSGPDSGVGTATGGDCNGPGGGTGGSGAGADGNPPGGGGAGQELFGSFAGGGGGGGYCSRTIPSGVYTPGDSIPVTVGNGGNAPSGAGAGADGLVRITWE